MVAVSSPINAVKTMVARKSAVCFGIGPEGDQHFILNRFTGNRGSEDDGVNYIQNLWVVPPDEVAVVRAQLDEGQHFTRRGR